MNLIDWKEEFPAVKRIVYLNTGTIGLIPQSVLQKHIRNLHFVYDNGPISTDVKEWLCAEYDLVRKKAAQFIGAEEEEIALVGSTTEGLCVPVLGFDWHAGDEIVTSDLEHPALTVPLELVKKRYGVKVRTVASADGVITAEDIISACTGKTRMICLSHVSYLSGVRFPIAEICRFARTNGIITCIDGAQSVGAFEVDVKEIGADFYSFPGYKWCLGLEGTAFLYVSREFPGEIEPYRLGYRSFSEEDDSLKLYSGARRYELATMPHLEFIAAGLALDFLGELGMSRVEKRIGYLTRLLKEGLRELDFTRVITPIDEELSAGLVTFTVENGSFDAKEIVSALADRSIIIRDVPWRGALRASLHLYNSEADIEKFLEALKLILNS